MGLRGHQGGVRTQMAEMHVALFPKVGLGWGDRGVHERQRHARLLFLHTLDKEQDYVSGLRGTEKTVGRVAGATAFRAFR